LGLHGAGKKLAKGRRAIRKKSGGAASEEKKKNRAHLLVKRRFLAQEPCHRVTTSREKRPQGKSSNDLVKQREKKVGRPFWEAASTFQIVLSGKSRKDRRDPSCKPKKDFQQSRSRIYLESSRERPLRREEKRVEKELRYKSWEEGEKPLKRNPLDVEEHGTALSKKGGGRGEVENIVRSEGFRFILSPRFREKRWVSSRGKFSEKEKGKSIKKGGTPSMERRQYEKRGRRLKKGSRPKEGTTSIKGRENVAISFTRAIRGSRLGGKVGGRGLEREVEGGRRGRVEAAPVYQVRMGNNKTPRQ